MIILFAILDVILAVIAVVLYLNTSKDNTPHIIMRTENAKPPEPKVKTIIQTDKETREQIYLGLMNYIDENKYPLYEQHTDDETQMAINVYDLRNYIKSNIL